jgi:hypothetical protein
MGKRDGMSIWESLAPAPIVMKMVGGLQPEMRAVVLVGDAATWPELDRLDEPGMHTHLVERQGGTSTASSPCWRGPS